MIRWITLVYAVGLTASVMAAEWDSDSSYRIGEQVRYQEESFIATMWNRGNAPSSSKSHWDGWVKVDGVAASFYFGSDYQSGDMVVFNGDLYLSKWGNRNESPDTSWYWRRLGEDRFIDVSNAITPQVDNPKSVLAILGNDENRNSIKDTFEAQVIDSYQHPELHRLALNASFTYRALHQLELDESINLLEAEAEDLFGSLFFWEGCMTKLAKAQHNVRTPKTMYIDTLESALYFRFGQNEAMQDLNGEYHRLNVEVTNHDCEDYEW